MSPITMTGVVARDVRFPTSENLDGSDAMNPAPDYSAAYAVLETDSPENLEGHGLTFTIGRGNELCGAAIEALAPSSSAGPSSRSLRTWASSGATSPATTSSGGLRGRRGRPRPNPGDPPEHVQAIREKEPDPVTDNAAKDAASRRPLGSTGLSVSPLCVGCAPLGDMPETFEYGVDEDRAYETLEAVFGSPINFLDTAASYGDGESERRIGEVLRRRGGLPEGVVLATKADRDLQTGEFSGDQMRRSVERSLKLLGVDRLQLCYLHDPENETFEHIMAPGGPVEVLGDLRDEGVIEHLGVAGGPIDLEIRYVKTGLFEAVITHNRYTLVDRSAEPLLDVAAERGVALLNAAPYGSGILAKGPDAYARYAYSEAPEEMVEKVRAMQRVCEEFGVPLAAAALRFSTRDPRVVSTIVGISRPERVEQTLKLASQSIPNEMWERLERLR